MPDIDELLKEFSEREPLLEAFCKKAHTLVEDLLQADNLRVHSVTFRVKRLAKLREKLQRENKSYERLDQITDQIGLRIITYYEDEVDQVAATIRREFEIDEENSVDKRVQEDPEKFTYSSLHYVCKINKTRLALGEYQRYAEIKFEIQIRSILQHAWAEIQHDWYDMQDRLPTNIRRRFSRLAGLLDLADSEFLDIRKKKLEYERSVSVRVEAKDPDISDIPLDQISIRSFVLQEIIVHKLDQKIADTRGLKLEDSEKENRHDTQLKLATFAGITTLGQLRELLGKYGDAILDYVNRCKEIWDRQIPKGIVIPGSCILQLSIILLAQKGDEVVSEVFEKVRIRKHSEIGNQLEIARAVYQQYFLGEIGS